VTSKAPLPFCVNPQSMAYTERLAEPGSEEPHLEAFPTTWRSSHPTSKPHPAQIVPILLLKEVRLD